MPPGAPSPEIPWPYTSFSAKNSFIAHIIPSLRTSRGFWVVEGTSHLRGGMSFPDGQHLRCGAFWGGSVLHAQSRAASPGSDSWRALSTMVGEAGRLILCDRRISSRSSRGELIDRVMFGHQRLEDFDAALPVLGRTRGAAPPGAVKGGPEWSVCRATIFSPRSLIQ